MKHACALQVLKKYQGYKKSTLKLKDEVSTFELTQVFKSISFIWVCVWGGLKEICHTV